MAFSNRFHFRYDSIHGVEYNIYILQDGYLGNCDERHLGRAPVLRKQKNGPICGTSLDLFAECVIDGEFAELFTSNPKEYRVDIMRRVNGVDVLVWQGFVSTELYSEPSIYPPYDVQIVSTDGLGELKLVDFVPAGPITLSEHFQSALAYTGMNRTIYVASSLVMTGESRTATFDMAINLDYMDGSNYYEVISKLLDTLHATITLYGDKWLILRETDVHSLLSESGLSVVSIAADGTISTTIIGGVHKTVGSMADNSMDTWPVGQLSTAIEPSRKEVTVEAPWHTISGPDDQNMEATIGSPWVTEGIVRHDTTDDCFYELGLDPEHLVSDDTWGTIKQEIPINKLDCGFRLRLRVAPRVYKLRVGDRQWYAHGNIKVHLEYDCYISSGSHGSERTSTYIGTAEGWKGAPQHTSDPKVEIPTTELDSIGERWLSVDIPAISTPESASRYIVSDSATVRIVIEGHWVEVYECILTPSLDLPGYRDIIHLNNDAVGSSSPVEITGGRVRSDNLVNSRFYGGIWVYNDAIVTSFADSVHSNGDFLSITALSYALSSGGRRLKTEGIINMPAAFSVVPLFITFDGILSSIETWEWDLFQEEATISAISLPAVEIDVESETVEGLEEDYSGRSSGGSGTGSSASSAYSYKSGGSSFFEEDGQGGIQLKEEYAGLRTKGYLIAASSGQGGGGGGGSIAVYTLPSLESTTFDPASEADTFNAYTIQSLHTRIKALEQSPGGVSSVAGLTGDVAASDLFTAIGLGTAATRAVGAIENANTGLVTGGDVYSFVNSSVATATATFRGTNTTATTEADFLTWADGLTHDLNDYVFWATTDAAGNTVYKRYKYDGASWVFEYNLNNSSFTAAQWAAINSGITSQKITGLDTALTNINGDITALQGRATELEKMFVKVSYTVGQETRYYLKLNPAYYDGIAAEGFGVFAASANFTPGGGGGGADLGQVWQSLTNAASPVDASGTTKIHPGHLPQIAGEGVTGVYSTTGEGAGLQTILTLDISGAVPSNLLLSLQAQIDSVSARNNYDELTATTLFADMAAIPNLYSGAIELAGADLSATLAGKQATISDLGTIRSYANEGHTAYGWGNHNLAGYLLAANFTAANVVSTLGTTPVNRATADSAGENIVSNMGTIGSALRSLQAQVDSVASRNGFDEVVASYLSADTISSVSVYGALHGNADTATNATYSTYATNDSAGANISTNMTTIGTALRSLQSQIDAVAASRSFDEMTVDCGFIDTLSVGAVINAGGEVYSTTGFRSPGYGVFAASASSSDARLKDNIQSLGFDKAIDLLGKLRGCEWTWNGKKDYLAGKHGSGLIAQEVEPVMPWAVLDLNGELSLNYNAFWGMAIPVMQSHESRIQELERRVAKLESTN